MKANGKGSAYLEEWALMAGRFGRDDIWSAKSHIYPNEIQRPVFNRNMRMRNT